MCEIYNKDLTTRVTGQVGNLDDERLKPYFARTQLKNQRSESKDQGIW